MSSAGVPTALRDALAQRYRIDHELGAGGMATAYLAEDLKHHRRVALKVLRPELGAVLGPERFLSEINVTANLQHPHLLPLFDSGEVDGLLFYVMPYIEGESLRARLERERQLPIDEAVRIATSILSALDYAHRHGVIHRDLKPENILLHDGQPLIADFGIALAVSNAGGARVTQTGLSLGTPQYMSPEQATGDRVIDGRSDIYSLAAVLYEMLVGDPPHVAGTTQAIVAKVLTERPPSVRSYRDSVPEHVDAAIQQALAKLPADRFTTAQQFTDALLDARAAPPRRRQDVVAVPRPAGLQVRHAAIFTALLAGGLVGAGVARYGATGNRLSSTPTSSRTEITLSPGAELALATRIPAIGYNSPIVALSADGAWLAYIAQTPTGTHIQLRDMWTGEVSAVPGTDGANFAFFSPDAEWIGFLTDTQVRKVARAGGTVLTLAEARSAARAWWREPDVIYFTAPESSTLFSVSAAGGTAELVLTAADAGVRRISDVLPGGRFVLADTRLSTGISGDFSDVVLVDVRTLEYRHVVRPGYAPRYLTSGHIIYGRAGSIMAVRFDADRGVSAGDPITLAAGAAMESLFGMLHASSSDNGTLAYAPGGDLSVGRLSWVDRQGNIEDLPTPERIYGVVDLSPDDQLLAVHVADIKDYVWIWDFTRQEGRRIAHPDAEGFPSWSSDGQWLAASSFDSAGRRPMLHQIGAGGRAGEGRALNSEPGVVTSWSPDSRRVAMYHYPTSHSVDEVTGAAAGPRQEGTFPAFSPDGKWIIYTSDQAGGSEVFLRSYPEGREAGQISQGGGTEPRWLPSGELFYRSGRIWYSTRVSLDGTPDWESPRRVFDAQFIDTPGLSYDVSRDGQRLMIVRRVATVEQTRLQIITNWTARLEQ
ncbi:MAG TPA: protein kinase [Longimicrobiales bacterium]|nr:protein kinase [Longimicrobiales bacterium]